MSDLGNKEVMAKNIKHYMKVLNIERKDLAVSVGVAYTTLSDWINAKKYPRIDKIEAMANLFGVLKSDLVEDKTQETVEKRILNENYDKLNKEDRTILVDFSNELVEKKNKGVEKTNTDENKLYPVNVISACAAGIGYAYGNNEYTTYYTDRNDLKPYDFATRVSGDSMFPKFNDGDIILLKQGYDNVNGDIYAIDYDGKSYVKKLYNDGDRYRLVSINDKYEPIKINIPIEPGIYFNIIGKVVDSFTPVK